MEEFNKALLQNTVNKAIDSDNLQLKIGLNPLVKGIAKKLIEEWKMIF